MREIDRESLPRVDKIAINQISIPLASPFRTSFGTKVSRESLIVEVAGEGVSGYAECVAGSGPYYSPETIGTAWHVISDYLSGLMLRTDRPHPDHVSEVFTPIRGNNMAKASVEMAYWDFVARSLQEPLSNILGGVRDRVPVGVSIGIQKSPDALVDVVSRYVAEGYRRVKLKIAPGYDVSYVQAVRKTFPDLLLQVDANSAYSLDNLQIFGVLDNLGLLLIEQPLAHDDIIDHVQLQKSLHTPICLDESIHSPEDARKAIEIGACRIINIKPGRVGGHTQSRYVHDLCRTRNIGVWVGGMLETNVGRAHNVALATLEYFIYPGDISASKRYFAQDIAEPDFELNREDSTISVPQSPGTGITVIPERLEKRTVQKTVFMNSRVY